MSSSLFNFSYKLHLIAAIGRGEITALAHVERRQPSFVFLGMVSFMIVHPRFG